MDTASTDFPHDLGPISPDWTISELLDWLSDDARQHDETLRDPLQAIDAAMTGVVWRRSPSTVALIRSIAATLRRHPASAGLRIAQLVADAAHAEPFASLDALRTPPPRQLVGV